MKHKDKIYHFAVCLALSLYRADVAITAAITKEYADSKAYGNRWSWGDIAADTAGIVLGVLIRCLFYHFKILQDGEISSCFDSIFQFAT